LTFRRVRRRLGPSTQGGSGNDPVLAFDSPVRLPAGVRGRRRTNGRAVGAGGEHGSESNIPRLLKRGAVSLVGGRRGNVCGQRDAASLRLDEWFAHPCHCRHGRWQRSERLHTGDRRDDVQHGDLVQGSRRARREHHADQLLGVLLPGRELRRGAVDQSAPGAFTNSPNTDGSWHELTGTATATTGFFTAQSANLEISLLCAPSVCPVGQAVWFDDAQMDTSPLAVTLYGFRAARSHRGVTLRWRTGTEAGTLAFNVYRQQGARRVRVNRRLLPALGGLGGSSYSFVDRGAPRHRAVRYWLQDVDTHGVRTWHGPVRVRAA
jgi:hypothetical protein